MHQGMQRNSGQRDVTGDGVMALGDDFWRGLLEDEGSRKMGSLQRPRGRIVDGMLEGRRQ